MMKNNNVLRRTSEASAAATSPTPMYVTPELAKMSEGTDMRFLYRYEISKRTQICDAKRQNGG